MMERLRYAWRALRGERELPPPTYPRTMFLPGGLYATVTSPDDEQKTKDWVARMAGWNGEHEA